MPAHAQTNHNSSASELLRPFASFGETQTYWLASKHHFSFGRYHNPQRMRHGTLRVVNDDWIKAGTGFDLHPHSNMEIITYVQQGAIHHRDNYGHNGVTPAGSVQVMSAGTGISHAEYADDALDTHIFQIWIEPSERDSKPTWQQAAFDPGKGEGLHLLASGIAAHRAITPEALPIRQQASLFSGIIGGDDKTLPPYTCHGLGYVVVTDGGITVNGQAAQAGDALALPAASILQIRAETGHAAFLLLDIPAVSQPQT